MSDTVDVGARSAPTLVDRGWQLVFKIAYPIWRRVRHVLGEAHGGAFVAIRSDDDICVVRHSYRPGVDFPGGGCSRGERPVAAAARELRQELGVDVELARLRPLGVVRGQFRGKSERTHLFEWRVAKLPPVAPDNREIIWAGPLSATGATWRELQLPVRWYLRRHGRELMPRRC